MKIIKFVSGAIGTLTGIGTSLITDRAIDKLTKVEEGDEPKTKTEKVLTGLAKGAVGIMAAGAVTSFVSGAAEGLLEGIFGKKD